MKYKTTTLFIAALMIFSVSTGALADIADPLNQTLTNVRFWALDDPDPTFTDNSDGSVTFTIVDFTGDDVQYSLTPTVEISWSSFINGTTISVDTKELVYLRLDDGSSLDYTGLLSFSGFDRTYYEVDAYNSLIIFWDEENQTQLFWETPTSEDDIGPVPIPGTVWILGSGIIGLVGIRRKFKG